MLVLPFELAASDEPGGLARSWSGSLSAGRYSVWTGRAVFGRQVNIVELHWRATCPALTHAGLRQLALGLLTKKSSELRRSCTPPTVRRARSARSVLESDSNCGL